MTKKKELDINNPDIASIGIEIDCTSKGGRREAQAVFNSIDASIKNKLKSLKRYKKRHANKER